MSSKDLVTRSNTFPLRVGLLVELHGLPDDLTPRDVERMVRWLRTLPCPESSIEVCECKRGAAHPGFDCPSCGQRIPEREREASERVAGRSAASNALEAIEVARERAGIGKGGAK